MKYVIMDSRKPKVLAPGMYAIDVETIPPRCRNNREVYLDYLKHLKESVETLREIIEEARVERPLDRSLAFSCLYTKHSHELLEYVFGTCPKDFNKRDKKQATTPFNRKKTPTKIRDLTFQILHFCLFSNAGRTDRPLVFGIRLLKTYDGESLMAQEFHKKFIIIVKFGNYHFGAIMGYGDYVIGDSVISRVYYIEILGQDLFVVGQFCDSDLEVAFRKHSCYVRDTYGVELIKALELMLFKTSRKYTKGLLLLVEEVVDGVVQAIAPTTAEQRLAKKNELNAKGTLLMALLDKHQLLSNIYKDAKSLMEAIEKRFSGNKKTKKVQKTLLKQQYEKFSGSSSEILDQIHDRLQKLISQLEILGKSLSQEDINLKFLRSLASSTNKSVSVVPSVSAAGTKALASILPNVDNLSEEMDLKWQMAMLTMRARRYKLGEGYHVVPPPYTGTFMPSKPDLVFYDAFTVSETIPNVFNVEPSTTKPTKEMSQSNRPFAPIIEDWVSDSEYEYEVEHPTQAANLRKDIPMSRGHKHSWSRKACFFCKSLNHLIKDCDYYEKQMDQKPIWNHAMRLNHQNSTRITNPHSTRHVVPIVVLTRSRLVPLNAARLVTTVVPQPIVKSPKPVQHVVNKAHSPIKRPINHRPTPKHRNFHKTITTVKVNKGNPQQALKDKGVIDSGCSRHMTGNISYLSEFKEINGGYVAFGENPKGGKIIGKGFQDKYVADGITTSTPIDTEKPLLKDPDGEDVDTVVVTSSTEAGYVAATSYRAQVLWIQNQLLDYGTRQSCSSFKDYQAQAEGQEVREEEEIQVFWFKEVKEVEMDADNQGRMEDDVIAVKEINAAESEPTVFDDEEVTMIMAQTLIKIKAEKARILDEQMSKRLQDEEIEQATAREKQEKEDLERIQEKHLDNIKKYQSLKRKPISVAQARKNMIVYLKNMVGYKIQYFKGMTYDQVRPIFEREYNHVQTFLKTDRDKEPTKKSVAKEIMLQESFKKLRAEVEVSGSHSTHKETLTVNPTEMSEEDVKNMLQIVPVAEFKVEALQVKYPLIDWEIYSEGSRTYWRIIRVGGITQAYKSFEGMVQDFDREDLDALWRITKEKFSRTMPTQDKEKALWAELTSLYEPNVADVFWKLQRYMHDPLTWKLYTNCGVHQVSSPNRHDIFMFLKERLSINRCCSASYAEYKTTS
nr:integrase, catalytic region, zinc finger, CCHC-type, peptidase aspartic, catalytic [Tanacetum cinerariifolium]